MTDTAVRFRRRVGKIALTWASLIVLMLSSAATAYIHLGNWNSAISLAIAAIKAFIVLWIFMNLGRASALIRLVAVVSVLTLAIFFVLSEVDYSSRQDQSTTARKPLQLPSVRPDEPLR